MLRLAVAATLALFALAGKGTAHEFWIAPEAFSVPAETAVRAELLVGETFRGSRQPFVPRRFTRFEVLTGRGALPAEGRLGDIPALAMEGVPEGLAVIVHETTAFDLTWDTWDAFARFAGHKDLGDVAAMQAERGLDREDVTEDYVRYAKSLVAVGHGIGADAVLGMRTEFVALANPYTDDLAGALPVQLWLDGAPRGNAQVELFARPIGAEDMAEPVLLRTDVNGIVILPVARGREYLVNAVTLEAMDPAEGAEWRTLWASLTFAVP